MIAFTWVHCGKELKVKDELAGRAGYAGRAGHAETRVCPARPERPQPRRFPTQSRRTRMQRNLVALIAFLAGTVVASADNWPSFRGPHNNGHSAEKQLPLTW